MLRTIVKTRSATQPERGFNGLGGGLDDSGHDARRVTVDSGHKLIFRVEMP